MSEKKPFERLPKDVTPTNYKLQLQPDLEKFTFDGSVDITVQVQYATSQITTNSVDIKISKAVFKSGGKDIESSEITFKPEDEKVTLTFASELPVGEGHLCLEFTGELNDKMKGFYRSNYTTPSGEKRVCAVTQFEATDARRAFPCWDEPAVKATFDVTLVVPKDRVALSNMNVTSDNASPDNADLRVVAFAQTPIMSTYLLAFIVGEFDYVEGKSSDGVLVRVYTPLGRKEQGDFALEVAVKTLPFYKDYFNIGFPLPKIDLIAIPDFAAGAMENWGLVTYRETALLVDPKNSSSASKQWVALVVGHELAHQWFGNLVTMEWWTHLWLNEGFASWIEYLCVDHCFPEYDIWTQFLTTDYTRALGLDALSTSHPIEVPVGHPDEVDEIFDLISYCKGSSVIRMLHDFIGDAAFRKGMNAYLTKHKYKNTQTEDLWRALGEASGKPIEEIMSSWTKQMGFPVIKVSAAAQEGNSRKITIEQAKFCADGPISGESPQWMVPVSIATSAKPNEAASKVVLDKPSLTVTLDVEPNQWVKVNPGTMGFYRVQYSPEMLEALLPGIRSQELAPRDRLGIESDLFALAKAGQASTVDVLKVIEAFVNEKNYTVWTEISTNLYTLGNLLSNTESKDLFKAFATKLFTQVYEHVSWNPKDGEDHLTALLRGLVVRVMGKNGHPHAVEEARKRFKAHCSGGEKIHADLRAPVYVTVLANGNEETFEEMLKYFRTQELHEEKERVLRSLGSIKDPALIQRVLEFSLTDEVRSQDTVFVIGGVTGHKEGKELAWKFVQDKWSSLHERYSGGFLLSRLVQTTTEGFVSEEKALEVEAFFKEHKAPAAERTIKQSLENIRLNKAWLARDAASIHQWLKTKAE
ncbi:puromycin-sensitive aminopeptidase-like [Amphiura filiformis]|uniref:puromycin-sensitive aminopeptidase-like n=1 Tax=Amphiura filiformis TaxID=82378 RepID=UPI003B20F5EF